MNVNLPLTPHLDQFVRELLANGRFQTEGDVVRAALQLMADQSVSQPFSAPRLNQGSESDPTNRSSDWQEFRKQLATDQAPHADTTQRSGARRSPRGLLADLRSAVGADEIKEARSKMWAGRWHGEA